MNLSWLLPSADEADGINETRGISATSLREFARHLREFAEICEYLLASDSHVIADDSQISLCPFWSSLSLYYYVWVFCLSGFGISSIDQPKNKRLYLCRLGVCAWVFFEKSCNLSICPGRFEDKLDLILLKWHYHHSLSHYPSLSQPATGGDHMYIL